MFYSFASTLYWNADIPEMSVYFWKAERLTAFRNPAKPDITTHVGGDEHGIFSQTGGQVRSGRPGQVTDDHPAALPHQPLRRGPAQTGGAARHQTDQTLQRRSSSVTKGQQTHWLYLRKETHWDYISGVFMSIFVKIVI